MEINNMRALPKGQRIRRWRNTRVKVEVKFILPEGFNTMTMEAIYKWCDDKPEVQVALTNKWMADGGAFLTARGFTPAEFGMPDYVAPKKKGKKSKRK